MTSPLDRLLDRSLETAFGRDEIPRPERDEPLPERVAHYRVTRMLGRGGLGSVYLAEDDQLGREVAVKVLHRRHQGDRVLLQRFREEAKTCSRLQHPGIVPVHELGTTDDGRIYYTMRVVGGDTLQHLVRSEGGSAAGRQRFLSVLERAAQAVAFAHSHDVVHGDLTPANVMVGAFGEVQVLDWGLSRSASAQTGEQLTTSDRALGTPAYMAPEQAVGADSRVDRRTDVFGLGAILCEVLTGKPPYVGDSVYQVHERAATGSTQDAFARLDAVRGHAGLVALAKRSLSKAPGERPADAGAFADELTRHLRELESRAHRFEVEAAEQRARAQSARRAKRLTTMLASSIVLAVIATSGTWLWWKVERDGRRIAANERAVAALTTARERHARAGTIDELETALAAIENSEVACADADVAPQHVEETAALRERTEAALAAARENEATRRLLDERRWHMGDDRSTAEVERDYRDSFRRCGIDLDDADEARVAESVRRHRLQMELSSSLHWWALKRRGSKNKDVEPWQPLLELADKCDQDAARTDLRRAFLAGEIDHLRRLAASPEAVEMSPETIDLLGQFLIASGDRQAAVQLYRRGHLRHPYDYDLCHDLATALQLGVKKPQDEVLAVMTTGAALQPESPHALVDLAMALLDAGKLDEARSVADRAIAIDPGYARAWLCSCSIRERQQDVDGAAEALRQYIGHTSDKVRGYIGLAGLFGRHGRREEGFAAARRAYEHGVTNPEDMITVGRMHAEQGALVEALDLFRRAAADARSTGEAQHYLGRVLSIAQQREPAIEALRRAVAEAPRSTFIRLQLGMTLASNGEFAEAREQLEKATQLGGVIQNGVNLVTQNLESIERSLEIAARLDVLEAVGELPPADEAWQFGDVAAMKGWLEYALRCYELAGSESPAMEESLRARRILVGGRAAFAPDTTLRDARRVALADEARAALEAQVDEIASAARAEELPLVEARIRLATFCLAPGLADSRDADAFAWLAEEDRAAWQQLWAKVDALRAEL